MTKPLAAITPNDVAARVPVSNLLERLVLESAQGASLAFDGLPEPGCGVIHVRIMKDDSDVLSLFRHDDIENGTTTFSSNFSQH